VPIPEPFFIYFPNDSALLPTDYEDGVVDPDGTTVGDSALVGGKPYTYVNKTDFGLNIKDWEYDNISYSGILDTDILTGLSKFLKEDCPACVVKVTGYVSSQVNSGNTTETNQANQEALAKARSEFGADIFRNILSGDKNISKRVKTAFEVTQVVNDEQERQDIEDYKIQRNAMIEFSLDSELVADLGDAGNTTIPQDPLIINDVIKGRFYSECDYFKQLTTDDSVVFDSLIEKLQYFHPAFHAITPEGFNSRLTFLQQCTRQGPTNNANGNPDNFAFGRPPVCILRIGDFYHTKIVIDNLSFSFDPFVWDLNPEGIGVQPMIATVDMSFSFIGGSSLAGPINKLQNALSFNYFANTEVYDPRADKIKRSITLTDSGDALDGEIVPGYLDQIGLNDKDTPEAETSTLDDNTNTPITNQDVVADDANNIQNEESSDNFNEFKDLSFSFVNTTSTSISIISSEPAKDNYPLNVEVFNPITKEVIYNKVLSTVTGETIVNDEENNLITVVVGDKLQINLSHKGVKITQYELIVE